MGKRSDQPDAGARAYDEIVEQLAHEDPEVKAGQMFGMPTLMRGRKAFGGFTHGEMVFKLTGPEHAEALQLSGAHLFDPADMGRPMKQWVVVPAAHHRRWEPFARAALVALRSQ